MPPVISHFAASGRGSNVPVGPLIGPKAGPTFATAVAALDKAVRKSKPSIPSPSAKIANVKNHMKKKESTEKMTSSEMGRLL